MERVIVKGSTLEDAYEHWTEYFHEEVSNRYAWFKMFIDPAMQENWLYGEEEYEMHPQRATRIRLLAGPHWYAYLKANAERIEYARKIVARDYYWQQVHG